MKDSVDRKDIALLLVRLALGVIFIAHGSQKAFGVFGGKGPAGVMAMVGGMGFHPPALWGWLLIAGELGGGLGLLFGFLTPLAALGIVVSMAVAIWKVHAPNGFFAPTGFEYPFSLLLAALALCIAGPGRLSLDYALFRRSRGGVVAAD